MSTVPLARILGEFVSDWRKERPSIKQRRGVLEDAVEPCGPYEFLSERTGLSQGTIRSMRNANRYPSTEYRVADAIVAAVGRPDAWVSPMEVSGAFVPPLSTFVQDADTAPRPILRGHPNPPPLLGAVEPF